MNNWERTDDERAELIERGEKSPGFQTAVIKGLLFASDASCLTQRELWRLDRLESFLPKGYVGDRNEFNRYARELMKRISIRKSRWGE